jgi:hypothetical protein
MPTDRSLQRIYKYELNITGKNCDALHMFLPSIYFAIFSRNQVQVDGDGREMEGIIKKS